MSKRSHKVIISCALTGGIHTPTMSSALPVNPDMIAEQGTAAARAGAAILHVHARDPRDGRPTPDPEAYKAFLPRLKAGSDAVINVTTGGGLNMTVDDCLKAPALLRPEMCSLNMGSMNGHSPDFHVVHGVLIGTQHPFAQGGMLVTDKKYRSFELTLEVKPDWGCDSGIFFRTTETGAAYQITMDYLGSGNGNIGRLIGEGGISLGTGRGGGGGNAPGTPSAASQAWKREDWNLMRIRVEGAAPKVMVWINNQLVNEQQDSTNHAPDGMVEGPIALQVHGGTDRWVPGGFWRWRNIGIKELPN